MFPWLLNYVVSTVFSCIVSALIYTTAHMYPYSGFEYFVKSGFDRELLKLHGQKIPHISALDVWLKMSQAQLYSSIRDNHATFLVKNTLFKEEVA